VLIADVLLAKANMAQKMAGNLKMGGLFVIIVAYPTQKDLSQLQKILAK
jgi:hypothetical protein